MTDIVVDTAARRLTGFGISVPCEIGRGGVMTAEAKREGDGATPLGRWPLRAVLSRRDRVGVRRAAVHDRHADESQHPDARTSVALDSDFRQDDEIGGTASLNRILLPHRWLRPDDGWCDDPADPAYNRPVRHPYSASAERLWRDDGVYDVIVVLGHNDAPPVTGRGSAIFLHCLEGRPTAGCVAIDRAALLTIVALARPGDALLIR